MKKNLGFQKVNSIFLIYREVLGLTLIYISKCMNLILMIELDTNEANDTTSKILSKEWILLGKTLINLIVPSMIMILIM